MARFLTAFLLAFALTLPALAQMPPGGRLLGNVVDDATGDPLPQATVALFSGQNTFVTGTSADAEGAFVLEGLRPGTYRVRISFVGFKSVEREDVRVQPGTPADLGTIRLVEDAALLGEAQVEAERELIEQQADRTVYNVAAQPVTAGGNALEALSTLPSVEVDTDGNLSLRGNQNVAVHLNGRPVPVRGAMLAALLRQIPATNVERVEVIPNPSARYEPDGMSGIINIVLKQGTSRGLSGGLTVGGGSAPNAEVSGNVAYQQGKVDAYASYGFRYDAFGMVGTSTRTLFLEAGTSTTDQGLALDNGTQSHLLSGTLDYTVAKNTTMGFSGTVGLRKGTADQAVTYAFNPGTAAERTSRRTTDGDVDGLNTDAALTFRRQIDGQQHQLTAEARFTRNTDTRLEHFADAALGATLLTRSDADDQTNELSAQADYVFPYQGFQVEAGGKATQRYLDYERLFERIESGTALREPGRSSDFSYDEGVYAAYLQLKRSFGPFDAQVGYRGEVATRDLNLAQLGERYDDRYTSHYPSAFLLYNAAPGTLAKASVSRRVNRPQAFFLNPSPRFEDTLIVDRGNPELRPEYTTALELTLQYKFFLTVTPFYRHTTDVIRRRILFDAATGVTTGTFQNLDTQDTYGADVTVASRIGPVRGFVSGSFYRAVTDGGSIETGLASDGFVWSMRGSVQAQLRKGTDVQLFAFYRGALDTEDGHISPFGLASLGLSQQLVGDKLRLAVRVNDVLSTSRFEFETGNGQYTFFGLRDPDIQQVSATLTYTFGNPGQRRQRPAAQPQQGGAPEGGIGF